MQTVQNTKDNRLLLEKFNNKNGDAFGEVYDLIYNELYYFTAQLYRDTPFVPSDIIHDIFMDIWQNEKQSFVNIINIKAYMYVSIRNRFKNDINHKKYVQKYSQEVRINPNSFISTIIETETLSIINQAIDLLPSEYAKVFKMHVDGWKVKEIAEILGKPLSTIYTQRQEAINLLKRKLSKHSFSIIMGFISLN